MFRKFCKLDILEARTSNERVSSAQGWDRLSKIDDFKDYKTSDGFLYVRVRAISSRTNRNFDSWPAEELAKSYRTFIGKPIFVDHHNHDPKQARGVVVDADLHVEDAHTSSRDPYYSSREVEALHLPATWIELLLEVDAQRFPKLAKAIVSGDIDSVSMGADVGYTVCNICDNKAETTSDFCHHIISKGAYFDHYDDKGHKTSKRSAEHCYKVSFFEISMVFDPADETALALQVKSNMQKEAGIFDQDDMNPEWEGPDPTDPPIGGPYDREADEGLNLEGEQQGETEADKVYQWRLNQFMQLGYPGPWAGELASSQIDYHEVSRAIANGASLEDAVSIYTPDPLPTGGTGEIAAPPGTVPEWRGEQYTRMGLSEDTAAALEASGADWHKVQLALDQGATEEQIFQIFSSRTARLRLAARKQRLAADGDGSQPDLPQSYKDVKPPSVDTMREDKSCPVCGNEMDEGACTVCGMELPPEGFDNPDIEAAQQIELERKEDELQGQNTTPISTEDLGGGGGEPMGAGMGADVGMGVGTPPVMSARVNVQERPLLPNTRQNSDKPIAPKTKKNPSGPVESHVVVDSDDPQADFDERVGYYIAVSPTTKPREDNMKNDKLATGASPEGGAEVAADERVDVTGVGGVGGDPLQGIDHEDVAKDTGDFTAPNTDTWSGNEGDSLGQQPAVTSEAFAVSKYKVACNGECDPADDCETCNQQREASAKQAENMSAPGFPDHEPAKVDLEGDLLEEVGDRTRTWSDAGTYETAPTVTGEGENSNELGGPIGVAVSSAKAQMLKAMKVARAEINAGILSPDEEFNRIAQLEDKSEDALDGILETLSKLQTSGPRQRVAGVVKPRLRNMPSMQRVATAFDIDQHAPQDAAAADAIW